MNGNTEFVRALSEFLAFHTEQPSSYFNFLIASFLQGAQARADLPLTAKNEIASRLTADMNEHSGVPSFLQSYLLAHLRQGVWPPQAQLIASRYLGRSSERLMAWQKRQQLIAPLGGETFPGTELGFRQMLFSQGAGPVFRWRGIPCFKSSYDFAIYAMLIDEMRPATIIELGSGSGASALLFADLCGAAGLSPQIISIDSSIGQISDSRIQFVQSDCSDWLAATAKTKREFRRPCLLIEDFHGDLRGFFEPIDTILEAGDYLIIEDSFSKQESIAEVIANRPYLVDTKYTDFFGVNCTSAINSIFRKTDDSAALQLRPQQEPHALQAGDIQRTAE